MRTELRGTGIHIKQSLYLPRHGGLGKGGDMIGATFGRFGRAL
ncbi:MAG: hypothetical protein ACKOW1_10630 [Novosphingobium sp.]